MRKQRLDSSSPSDCFVAVGAAFAAGISSQDVARLGKELTPFGGEKAGQRRRLDPGLGRRHREAAGRLPARPALRRSLRRRRRGGDDRRQEHVDLRGEALRGAQGHADGLPLVPDEGLSDPPQRLRPRTDLRGDGEDRRGGAARARRQRRHRRARRHPLPDPGDRHPGHLEPPAPLPRRDRGPARHTGRADARRPVHPRRVQRGDDVPLPPARDDRGGAAQPDPAIQAGGHRPGPPGRRHPAGARVAQPGRPSRATPGSTTRASAASAALPRSPTTTRAPPPTTCARATSSTCSTARPTSTTGSWSARRRSTSPTTPTGCRTRR